MPELKNYYRILQVDPSAETEIITAAYRRLAQKYHPDANRSPDATRRMQEINEAYGVLSNPEKRAHYNLLLSASAQPRPRPDYPHASSGGSYQGDYQPRAGQTQSPNQEAYRRRAAQSAPPHPQANARYRAAQKDEETEKSNRQLGYGFIIIYFTVLFGLLYFFGRAASTIWGMLFILVIAAVITIPLVFRLDDFLRKR